MRINGCEVPVGLSVSPAKYAAEELGPYVDAGIDHFEIGVPYRLPDHPLARTPAEKKLHPYTKEEIRSLSSTGSEQVLTALSEPFAAALARRGLAPWSIHLPFGAGWDIAHFEEEERRLAVEKLCRVIDLTIGWGPRVYVIHGCLEPVADGERETRLAHSVVSLRALAAHLAPTGARLALEDLPRSCLGNCTAEVDRMSAEAGVGVCFDVNHLLRDSHREFLDALERRIVTLHLSDYDGVDERHWMPGEGVVPWRLLFDRLQAAGYRGPWLFELKDKPAPEALLAAFRRAVEG